MVGEQPLILIVGVCAAGKSTLSQGLTELGYNARSLAQEHSASPHLWQRRKPDILILLDCSYKTVKLRKTISWGEKRYQSQQTILADARQHADLVVRTDSFRPEQLVSFVDCSLRQMGVFPRGG